MSVCHVVLWRFPVESNGPNLAGNIAHAADLLRACATATAGIEQFEVGVDSTGDDGVAQLALVSRFLTWDALEVYKAHPAHVAAVAHLKTMARERLATDWEA